jgi:transposase
MSTPKSAVAPAPKRRRKHTKEFKLEAVNLARRDGVGFGRAAKDLDINESLLRSWADKQDKQGEDAHRGHGRRAALEAVIAQQQREIRTLMMEREILKKAAAFFAKESERSSTSSKSTDRCGV